jgi:D-galactarolactone isomerase
MSDIKIGRRVFLGGTGLLTAAAINLTRIRPVYADQQVPFSAGTAAPKLKAPANACDSHIHIFDPRFPASPHWKGQPPDNAPVEAYRLFQRRIGTSRVVIVNPSTYGTDNRATLDAATRIGTAARAVVVVDLDTTDRQLREMADQGASGIRINFVSPQSWGVTTVERLETMAKRISDLGWHVQIYATGDQIVELENVLARLPTPIVIDHLGRLPQPVGVDHPAQRAIRTLLDRGRTWLKLSGAYLNTKFGPPDYADATKVAQSFVQAAPERMVWGSDWPHRGEKEMPDDATLFDLLTEWAPIETVRHRILVENPEALYGFTKST